MEREKQIIEEMALNLIMATSPLGVKDLTKVFDYNTVAKDLYELYGWRKEGISAFTDEGSKWCSYQAFLKKPNSKSGVQQLESSFDTDEFFQAALERSEREMRERWGKK